jgi:hypothetical protein
MYEPLSVLRHSPFRKNLSFVAMTIALLCSGTQVCRMGLLGSQVGNIHFFLMALICANMNETFPLRNLRQRIGREWGVSASNGMVVTAGNVKEVEVLAKATRRRFSAEYKLKILREADACTQPGNLGALFH